MRLGFLTKSKEAWSALPTVSPAEPPRDVEALYREAEREFTQACAAVLAFSRDHFDMRFVVVPGIGVLARRNAMDMDPERKRIERERDRALTKRNQLLAERAELRKTLGLVR
jgi:hypothetical protein